MRALLPLLAFLLLASGAYAQDAGEDLRRVILTDGTVYFGTVEDENADPVVLVTRDGVRREFARSRVQDILPLINGKFYRTDPVRTRFFLAPTARTLGGGEFRGDLTYFFPSLTAGVSDRLDFTASGLIGAVSSGGNDEFFFSPLVGVKGQIVSQENLQVALGVSTQVQLGAGGSFSALPYGVVTIGDETQAFTFGVGGAVGSFNGEVEVANAVVLGAGAEKQLNNGVKIFGEALTTIGEGDSGLLILPGVRFFGDRFAFDVIGFVATDFSSVVGFAPIGFRASYGF